MDVFVKEEKEDVMGHHLMVFYNIFICQIKLDKSSGFIFLKNISIAV